MRGSNLKEWNVNLIFSVTTGLVFLFKSKRVECKYFRGRINITYRISSNLKEWNVNEPTEAETLVSVDVQI